MNRKGDRLICIKIPSLTYCISHTWPYSHIDIKLNDIFYYDYTSIDDPVYSSLSNFKDNYTYYINIWSDDGNFYSILFKTKNYYININDYFLSLGKYRENKINDILDI